MDKDSMKTVLMIVLPIVVIAGAIVLFNMRKTQTDVEYLEELLDEAGYATERYWIEHGDVHPDSMFDLVNKGYLDEKYYSYHETEIRGFYVTFDYGNARADGYEYQYMAYKPQNDDEKTLEKRKGLFLIRPGLFMRDSGAVIDHL